MVQKQLPDGIGLTAVAAAQERFIESRRQDRLFNDELSEAFVSAAVQGLQGDHLLGFIKEGLTLSDVLPDMRGYVPLRTRYFDDEAIVGVDRASRQVVVLGSGFDSRAFRLTWPDGTTVYEIDTPEMMAFKSDVLSWDHPLSCFKRCVVGANFADDWTTPLLKAGFEPAKPTVWLAEALLIYLPVELCADLVAALSGLSANGSSFVVEHAFPAAQSANGFAVGRKALARNRSSLSSLSSAIPDPVQWLHLHGWEAKVVDLCEFARSYGRVPPPIVDPARGEAPAFWMASAVRSPFRSADGRGKA